MDLDPSPHGQAALMLCESILILLIERGLLHRGQALEAIENLVEVKQEIAGTSEAVIVSLESIGLLRGVAQSVSAAGLQPGSIMPSQD